MTLDEYAMKVVKDILYWKWIFIPETNSIRIWTCVKKDDKVIDVRDISEDELYGHKTMKKILEHALTCKESPKE